MWQVHIVVVAVLFLASAIVPAFTVQLAQSDPFKEMLSVQSALLNQPYVSYATISTNTRTLITTNEDPKTTNSVSSQVFLKSHTINDVEMARGLAAIVIANYPEAIDKDTIQITLTYGYEIGIASKWSTHPHSFSPDEIPAAE